MHITKHAWLNVQTTYRERARGATPAPRAVQVSTTHTAAVQALYRRTATAAILQQSNTATATQGQASEA